MDIEDRFDYYKSSMTEVAAAIMVLAEVANATETVGEAIERQAMVAIDTALRIGSQDTENYIASPKAAINYLEGWKRSRDCTSGPV